MEHDGSNLEAAVERLSKRLSEVERRLAALECAGPAPGGGAPAEAEAAEAPSLEEVAKRPSAGEAVQLIGRTLVILAGAFALRAITEAGVVPQVAGAAIGIAYAMLWIVLAGRAGRRERRSGATFHGLAGAMIAFPLLWETTTTFGFLSPVASAIALAVITALGLAVAARSDLKALAWIITVGGAGTALALAVSTKTLIPFAVCLLVLGFETLWLGYTRRWHSLGWMAAVVVDVVVALITLMALRGAAERVAEILDPRMIIALQLSLVVFYLGSFVHRALMRSRDLRIGEIAQGVAALAVGLGGAAAITHSAGMSGVALGVVALVLATACYAAAFTFIDRWTGWRWNFIFYSSVALVCALVGFGVLLDGAPLTGALVIAALITAWLGSHRERATLSLHGAVYTVAAAATSALLSSSMDALTGPTVPEVSWITVPALSVVAAAAAYCAMPVATHGRTWGPLSPVPKLAILVVLAVGVGGMAVSLGSIVLGGRSGAPSPPELAVLRTGMIAVAAVSLAVAGRWPRLREAAWLVYPVLVAGGIKLVVEDVRQGGAVALLLSFALYGGALIVAPRLTHRK